MKTIAILNEKGGTAKTTTSVNLAAALGEMGKKVLLVDLDGQAASSRWLGVEGDTRLADAMVEGSGLAPIDDVLPGVSLAPASGKLDSISHNLRPTQGSQLRRVLAEVKDRYDYILIDCPPSLGNRLIGNALLAASHALVPVETSILALDGLRILLTMLDDIREGFEHDIELIGALGCRFNSRTRLSRLVLAELHRALPGKVFGTAIHETVRMQECPAAGKSILEYAPDCSAAGDYRAVAQELVYGIVPCEIEIGLGDLVASDEVDPDDRHKVSEFRKRAGELFRSPAYRANNDDDMIVPEDASVTEMPQLEHQPDSLAIGGPEDEAPEQPNIQVCASQDVHRDPDARNELRIPVRSVNAPLAPQSPERDEPDSPEEYPPQSIATSADKGLAAAPATLSEPVEPVAVDEDDADQVTDTVAEPHTSTGNHHNIMVKVAVVVLLGILGIGGWVGFKALTPVPQAASAGPALLAPNKAAPPVVAIDRDSPPTKPEAVVVESTPAEPDRAIVISAPGQFTPDLPQEPADKADAFLQAEKPPKVAVKPLLTEKPTEGSPGETVIAAVSKPASSIVNKGKPELAPTSQPSSKAPTTRPASPASGKDSPESPRSARAEDYPTGLTLTGVMYGRTSRRAIISGNVAYEGDKVKGVRIVKINPDSVEVEANGFRFLLGTGPKPVWLKATKVSPPKDKNAEKAPTDSDSNE